MNYHLTQALCQLDDQARPCGYASGCIVAHRNVRILITVSHAVGNQGDWALEVQWDSVRKAEQLQRLGAMGFIRRVTVKGKKSKASDVDFAYARVPYEVRPRLHLSDRVSVAASAYGPKPIFLHMNESEIAPSSGPVNTCSVQHGYPAIHRYPAPD